jgi:hypothetical protein
VPKPAPDTEQRTGPCDRRYRLVDEGELRQAQEMQQGFLTSQVKVRKVVPLRTGTEN